MGHVKSLAWRALAGACALVVVAGCSSNKTREDLLPAELKDVPSEVRLHKLWSHGVGDGQGEKYNRLQPAVLDGVVYAASVDGSVAAYRLADGEEVWETELEVGSDDDNVLSGGVGAGAGLVLVGTADGQLVALRAADGGEAWRTQVSGEVLSAPAVSELMVVVQTFDGRVFGLDPATGARRWDFDSSMPPLTLRGGSEPRISGNTVYAGFANGRVAAISADKGMPLWEVRVAVPKGKSEIERIIDVGGVLLDGSMLYAVSYQGNALALDTSAGSGRWRHEISSYVPPVLSGSALYIADSKGKLVALNVDDGEVRWENSDLANRQLTGPAAVGDYVAVGDFEGYLHLLSKSDGHIAGRLKVDSDGLRAPFLEQDGYLIVYSNSGDLVVYTLKEGAGRFFGLF